MLVKHTDACTGNNHADRVRQHRCVISGDKIDKNGGIIVVTTIGLIVPSLGGLL